MGDGMMTIFFENEHSDCAAVRAIRCAQECVNSVAKLFPNLTIGIGMHYGSLIAGNIGSSSRLEYTVIGDTVNVAARLEEMTKKLGAAILCSETVHQQLQDSELTDFGVVSIRGKTAQLRVWGSV